MRRFVPGLLVVAALVAAAAVVVLSVGAGEQTGILAIVEPPVVVATELPDIGIDLLPSDRDEFSVCVDGAGFEVSGAQVAMVRKALGDALVLFPDVPRRVAVGCPPPTALTGERLKPHESAFEGARAVDPPALPSPYILHVYFVSSAAYDASFEWAYPYRLTGEEYSCHRGGFDAVCFPVTIGMYVKPDVTTGQLMYGILSMRGLGPDPYDACTGRPQLPSWIAASQPWWCDEFWRDVGVTPPAPTSGGS